ncbi:hypothetical protein, partial [Flavonifractor sp. An52]|uniref:hypothetical protein n=1 Tax=Flavonifractor sp. An52 TaxID=1965642 RepID=UPI0019524815
VKLTSGFLLPAQLIRNLVLQDFSVTGSKSCKPEVTFAIHHAHPNTKSVIYNNSIFSRIKQVNDKFARFLIPHS